RERRLPYQTSLSRFALREVLLVGIAGLASFVFINHNALYLSEPFHLSDVPIESYILATSILYLFLRMVIIIVEMRPPPGHAELVQCPECGQWLDDLSDAGLEAHRRIELTPKPSQKEVVSAVALRKAVDAARFGTKSEPENRVTAAHPVRQPSNVSEPDLIAALNDPDFLERARHSPQPPTDPRIKR
ncbi:MAG: hypothetical protein ACREDF_02875, partial [Thermoplasmata archaeon]